MVGGERYLETFARTGNDDERSGGIGVRRNLARRHELGRRRHRIDGDVTARTLRATCVVAEQVAPQRKYDGEHKNPHEGEESEAEDEERQFTHELSPGSIRKVKRAEPILMTSPCSNGDAVMRVPLRTVPFVDPKSSSPADFPFHRIRA